MSICKRLKLVVLVLVLSGWSFSAQAFKYPDLSEEGGFMGIQIGYADLDTSAGDFPPGTGVTSIDDGDIGARLFFGYQLSHNWAIELGFAYWGESEVFVGAVSDEVAQYHIDLLAKGGLDVMGGFSVYGKLGPALVTSNRGGILGKDEDAFAILCALGASYELREDLKLDFSANKLLSLGDTGDSLFIAGGAIYRLG